MEKNLKKQMLYNAEDTQSEILSSKRNNLGDAFRKWAAPAEETLQSLLLPSLLLCKCEPKYCQAGSKEPRTVFSKDHCLRKGGHNGS